MNLKNYLKNYLEKENTNKTLSYLKYFLTIFIDTKNISIKQINSSLNKLKYIINRDIEIVCYFNLIMLKIVDKKSYYALLINSLENENAIIQNITEYDELVDDYRTMSQITGRSGELIDYYRELSKNTELVYA